MWKKSVEMWTLDSILLPFTYSKEITIFPTKDTEPALPKGKRVTTNKQTRKRGFSGFKKGAVVEELILQEVLIVSVWLAVGDFQCQRFKDSVSGLWRITPPDLVCYGIKAAVQVTNTPLRFGDFLGWGLDFFGSFCWLVCFSSGGETHEQVLIATSVVSVPVFMVLSLLLWTGCTLQYS